jgi:hypothetical protein
VLQDLKRQVDNFRNKLETPEHLSWLGEWFLVNEMTLQSGSYICFWLLRKACNNVHISMATSVCVLSCIRWWTALYSVLFFAIKIYRQLPMLVKIGQ